MEKRRDVDAENVGGVEIDDQLELGGLLNWQVSWLDALADVIHLPSGAPGQLLIAGSAIATSYSISRALGLPLRIAILVPCGNSICGNSAIAAIAPLTGADNDDVASSISFTAVLGVVVVLVLPLFAPS